MSIIEEGVCGFWRPTPALKVMCHYHKRRRVIKIMVVTVLRKGRRKVENGKSEPILNNETFALLISRTPSEFNNNIIHTRLDYMAGCQDGSSNNGCPIVLPQWDSCHSLVIISHSRVSVNLAGLSVELTTQSQSMVFCCSEGYLPDDTLVKPSRVIANNPFDIDNVWSCLLCTKQILTYPSSESCLTFSYQYPSH